MDSGGGVRGNRAARLRRSSAPDLRRGGRRGFNGRDSDEEEEDSDDDAAFTRFGGRKSPNSRPAKAQKKVGKRNARKGFAIDSDDDDDDKPFRRNAAANKKKNVSTTRWKLQLFFISFKKYEKIDFFFFWVP